MFNVNRTLRASLLDCALLLFVLLVNSTLCSNSDYCYINDIDACSGLTKCETDQVRSILPLIQYMGGCAWGETNVRQGQYLTPGGNTSYCTYMGQKNVECQAACGNNGTGGLNCCQKAGSTGYCADHTCSEPCYCYCEMVTIVNYQEVEVDGVWHNVTQIRSMATGWVTDVSLMKRKLLALEEEKGKMVNLNAQQVIAAMTSTGIKIQMLIRPVIIIIRKLGNQWSTVIPKNDTIPFEVELPPALLVTSGIFQIEVWQDANLIDSIQLSFVASTMCKIYDCISCWDSLTFFNCLTTKWQAVVILEIILLIILIICLSPFLLWVIQLAFIALMLPFKMSWWLMVNAKDTVIVEKIMSSSKWYASWASGCFRKVDRIQKKMDEQSNKKKKMTKTEIVKDSTASLEDGSSIGSESEESSANGKDEEERLLKKIEEEKAVRINRLRDKYNIAKKGSDKVKAAIVLMMLIGMALSQQCTQSLSSVGTFTNCVDLGSGVSNCNLTTSLSLFLLTKFATSCVDLVDSNGESKNIMIRTTHLGTKATYLLEDMYFTSDWTPLSISAHRCWMASANCGPTGFCESVAQAGAPVNANGELTLGSMANLPGRTSCRRSCAGGCVSCFFADPGCVFSRWAIQPLGTVYKVSRPGAISLKSIVKVEVITPSGNDITYLEVGSPVVVKDMNAVFVGTFEQPVYTFAQNVISNTVTGSAWIGSTAARDAPCAMCIGDLQAATPSALTAPTLTSFLFAPNNFRQISGETTESFVFNPSGLGILNTTTSLPNVFGGDIWSFSSGSVSSNITNPSSAFVNLAIRGTYKVKVTSNLVCPSAITLLSAGGCLNCKNGTGILIRMRSTCATGLVSLSSNDPEVVVVTSFIFLNNTDFDFLIRAFTGKVINDFELKVSGTGGAASTNVRFTAFQSLEINTTRPDIYTGTSYSGPGAGFNLGSFGEWMDSVLKGAASAFNIFLFVLFIIGIVCLVALIIAGLIPITWVALKVFQNFVSFASAARNLTDVFKKEKKV